MKSELLEAQENSINMPEIDIRRLLECACEQFLLESYRALLGREPDAIGAIHYARRLQLGVPRIVILAEIRASKPGQEYVRQASSRDLDRLIARYRNVRGLPLGKFRWWFLPSFDATASDDEDFNWENWANDYSMRVIQRQAGRVSDLSESAPLDSQVSQYSEMQIRELNKKVDSLAVALEVSASALRARGESEQIVRPLDEALNEVSFDTSRFDDVSWEAKQYLNLLVQNIRS